jgi:hypothetical protein
MKRILVSLAALGCALSAASAQIERANFDSSPFALGSLTERDGALPRDLWQGAQAETIAGQLTALPTRFEDPAKQEILRRILLSPGEGPQGADAQLAGVKLLKAAEAGYAYEAGALAELTPGLTVQPALSRIVAIRDLYAGDTEQSCGRGAGLREGRQQPFFVRLRIFCYLYADERPAAELTMSLAREEGVLTEQDERVFASLMAGVTPTRLPTDALSYAAFRRLGGLIAPSDVPGLRPAVAAAAALDQGLSSQTREAALLRSAEESLLPPRELGDAAMRLRDSELQAIIASIRVLQEGSAERQGAIGQALLNAGTDADRFHFLTKAFSQEIASTTPGPTTVPYAVEFALASLLIRRFDAAERWMQTVAGEQTMAGERAFSNLANLYGAVRPSAAQRLAGAIGETIIPPEPVPFEVTDPLAQVTDRAELAETSRRAILAAREGSRGGMLIAALSLAAVPTDGEAGEARDTMAETLYEQSDLAAVLDDIRFQQQARSFAGKLRDGVVNQRAFVPRVKPSR